MSTRMTKAEREAFLKDVRVGVFSFNEPDRGPLTVPIWYDYEPGGDLWFLIGRESRKGKLLEVGTRLSMCAQDENVPYRYVTVEGPVTELATYSIDNDTVPMATRYLGAETGRRYTEDRRADGTANRSIKVVMRPEHWLTVDYTKISFP